VLESFPQRLGLAARSLAVSGPGLNGDSLGAIAQNLGVYPRAPHNLEVYAGRLNKAKSLQKTGHRIRPI
jgi:hypothetical protein